MTESLTSYIVLNRFGRYLASDGKTWIHSRDWKERFEVFATKHSYSALCGIDVTSLLTQPARVIEVKGYECVEMDFVEAMVLFGWISSSSE